MAGCETPDNCTIELAELPLLSGCPANDEWFLVGNAVDGKGKYGYARRRYDDIKACIAGSISFVELNFTIGQPGAPMSAGDVDLVIDVNNAIQNSELVVLDNSLLIPDLSDQISYTASWSDTRITITFNQAVADGQKYYIKYAKI